MEKEYKIIIWFSQQDYAFIAQVPQLPGCMTHGDTEEEAIENIRIVIDLWIQTAIESRMEIPQPGFLQISHRSQQGLVLAMPS